MDNIMEITIEKNKYGSLFAYNEKSNYPLFQFEYRHRKEDGGRAWYFWLRGNYDPDIIGGGKKDFPMEFFLDACRAKSRERDGLDEQATIARGADLITK